MWTVPVSKLGGLVTSKQAPFQSRIKVDPEGWQMPFTGTWSRGEVGRWGEVGRSPRKTEECCPALISSPDSVSISSGSSGMILWDGCWGDRRSAFLLFATM